MISKAVWYEPVVVVRARSVKKFPRLLEHLWRQNMHRYLFADIIGSEMRTVFQKQSSRKTVSFEEQNTVVPKIHRHSLSYHIPYYLAWRPNPEKPGIWNYKTIFSFHWDTTEVWRPHFDVKKVLLSRKTGSVSIGKRLLHFIFGDAQLLKFGYHTIRGRLPLTTAFIYGQSPITRLLPCLPQLKIVVICTTAKKFLYKLQCYTG